MKGNVIVASDVENLDVKVGISPVSMENAAANIRPTRGTTITTDSSIVYLFQKCIGRTIVAIGIL